MKKTIITLLALSGVAMAETATVELDFANAAQAVPTEVTLSGADVSGTVLSLTNADGDDVGILTAGDVGKDAGIFTPNTNVGSDKPWTAEFKISGLGTKLQDVSSMTFNFAMYTGGGAWQSSSASWTGDVAIGAYLYKKNEPLYTALTMNGKLFGGTDEIHYGPDANNYIEVTIDGVTTMGTPFTLTNDDYILRITLTETLNNGTYIGLDNISFTGTATAPIPEPTTATLSLLALAGLAARRRRR